MTAAPSPIGALAGTLAERLRQAFLDHGYEQMTMSGLAQLCGFSRRALYHHFSSKEEAFRHWLDVYGRESIDRGLAAGRRVLDGGGDAVDVIVEVMDVRYGDARRRLGRSPHALEINDQAFRRGRDLMVAAAVDFQARVAGLLVELEARRLLRLKPGVTPAALAQSLCDGARGTNQALPPIDGERLPRRYRTIIEAILYGAAVPAQGRKRPAQAAEEARPGTRRTRPGPASQIAAAETTQQPIARKKARR
ncbi:TetR family transcriptional regulator [Reyranella sp.]|uniref:TetR/AcrR family transcriptional regulator n=1 Tax=Reyranella sp. TaxID=1929291 RepID=UPI003BAA77C9